jgi:hypothetical protein
MGRRKAKVSTPLGDPRRRPFALPHVKRKQAAAEREALAGMSDEQRAHQLQKVADALAALGADA